MSFTFSTVMARDPFLAVMIALVVWWVIVEIKS